MSRSKPQLLLFNVLPGLLPSTVPRKYKEKFIKKSHCYGQCFNCFFVQLGLQLVVGRIFQYSGWIAGSITSRTRTSSKILLTKLPRLSSSTFNYKLHNKINQSCFFYGKEADKTCHLACFDFRHDRRYLPLINDIDRRKIGSPV